MNDVSNEPSDTSDANLHESSLIQSFIVAERRDRYRLKLRDHKKRAAFLDRLNHRFLDDVDARFVVDKPTCKVPVGDSSCYLIASEATLDAMWVAASDVSAVLLDVQFGIVVSYLPGKLIAYKDESPSKIVWLQR